jgi:hypothetical protein
MAKKNQHHTLALLSFAIVAILALGAFAYIYLNQAGYGFSIAGTRGYAESMLSRGAIQVPGGAENVQIIVRTPQTIGCVCEKEVFSVSTGQSKGFKPFASNRPLPHGADPTQTCRDWCEKEQKAKFLCAGAKCAQAIY